MSEADCSKVIGGLEISIEVNVVDDRDRGWKQKKRNLHLKKGRKAGKKNGGKTTSNPPTSLGMGTFEWAVLAAGL